MTRFRYLDLHTAVAWEGVADMITGKSARLAKQAQDRQAAMLADEKAKTQAVEDAQRRVTTAGGGGLLAYVDDATKVLRKSFGA